MIICLLPRIELALFLKLSSSKPQPELFANRTVSRCARLRLSNLWVTWDSVRVGIRAAIDFNHEPFFSPDPFWVRRKLLGSSSLKQFLRSLLSSSHQYSSVVLTLLALREIGFGCDFLCVWFGLDHIDIVKEYDDMVASQHAQLTVYRPLDHECLQIILFKFFFSI